MSESLTTIHAATAAMRAGKLHPRDLVQQCLARIETWEPQLRAWVVVDAAGALAAADRLGARLERGEAIGPLHGAPIGVKDIIDVAGLPTLAGSPLRADMPAAVEDAPVVARLRAAGAIILGKTVTTEFACFDPPPTANPWNGAHTPGGSSSGSAAGTAVGGCLAALGSQTGGSINRPATYCGVAGLKPTYDAVSRVGVVPVSERLDHVGPLARCVADLRLLWNAIRRDGPVERAGRAVASPRFGTLGAYFRGASDAATQQALEAAKEKLTAAGAEFVEVALPEGFDRVHAWHGTIMAYEAAQVHRPALATHRQHFSDSILGMLDRGLTISKIDYDQAVAGQQQFALAVERSLAEVDALILPATPAPAPASRKTTGDPKFNSPWSFAGAPALSLPMSLDQAGMPLGLQLVGSRGGDDELLDLGEWVEPVLDFKARPTLLSP